MRNRHRFLSLQVRSSSLCLRSSSINILEDIGNSENDDGESGGRAFCNFGATDRVRRKETQNTENPTDTMILLTVRIERKDYEILTNIYGYL